MQMTTYSAPPDTSGLATGTAANIRLQDGGPLYTETVSHFHELVHGGIVEPFNATSAVVFFFVALVWLWHTYSQRPENTTVKLWSGAILAIGGIGGTLFHGTRSHPLWLVMDVLPIVVLIFMYCIFLFRKMGILKQAFVLIALSGLVRFGLRYVLVSEQASITLGYASMGVLILYPIALYLIKLKYAHIYWVLGALGAFSMALVARIADSAFMTHWLRVWPQGTHFIWHSFGALAVALLITFWHKADETEKAQGGLR